MKEVDNEIIFSYYDTFFKEAKEVFIKKDVDYGKHWLDSRFKNGMHLLVHMEGKVSRLINLLENGKKPNFESTHDSCIDLANFSNMLDTYIKIKESEKIK